MKVLKFWAKIVSGPLTLIGGFLLMTMDFVHVHYYDQIWEKKCKGTDYYVNDTLFKTPKLNYGVSALTIFAGTWLTLLTICSFCTRLKYLPLLLAWIIFDALVITFSFGVLLGYMCSYYCVHITMYAVQFGWREYPLGLSVNQILDGHGGRKGDPQAG